MEYLSGVAGAYQLVRHQLGEHGRRCLVLGVAAAVENSSSDPFTAWTARSLLVYLAAQAESRLLEQLSKGGSQSEVLVRARRRCAPQQVPRYR